MKKLFFLILFFTTSINYAQGKLDLVEESLKKKRQENLNLKTTIPKHKSSSYTDHDNPLLQGIGELFVGIFLYASYYTIIESPFEKDHKASSSFITKYPYYNSYKGNYAYNWGDDTEIFRTEFSSRFIAENSKIYGNHLNADMRFLNRGGLELDYLQLWEENTNFENNSLALFTAVAKYHRIRTEKFNAWWGLGATYVSGEVKEFGFAYALGAELLIGKPLSLETNFYMSSINQEPINKYYGLLNYQYKKYVFSGGYEYLKIGKPSFSTFSIGIGFFF